jgi:phage gpG-like protein
MRGARSLASDFQRAVRSYIKARRKALMKAGHKVRASVVKVIYKGHGATNPMGSHGHLNKPAQRGPYAESRTQGAHLRQSIQVQVDGTKRVRIGTNVVYSRIQELGGVIRPRRARALSWIDPQTGARRFAQKVVIPARPYMGPGLMAAEKDIEDEFVVMHQELLPGN